MQSFSIDDSMVGSLAADTNKTAKLKGGFTGLIVMLCLFNIMLKASYSV